jgi:hypothetical protein
LTIDAVSELWWPTTPALIEQFYASEEARMAVADDTIFVERATATPVVTIHTILRTPPQEVDQADIPRWVAS